MPHSLDFCPHVSLCPCRYRGFDTLEHMLRHANQSVDVLYYEVLDLPLPQLEQLKTLRVRIVYRQRECMGTRMGTRMLTRICPSRINKQWRNHGVHQWPHCVNWGGGGRGGGGVPGAVRKTEECNFWTCHCRSWKSSTHSG